jgi:hypothetical protein
LKALVSTFSIIEAIGTKRALKKQNKRMTSAGQVWTEVNKNKLALWLGFYWISKNTSL